MAALNDSEKLLEALYNQALLAGGRPSVMEARMQFLPEWTRERSLAAAESLLTAGDILRPTGALLHVDISSTARDRVKERIAQSAGGSSTNYHIGAMNNSPLLHVSSGAHGVQNINFQITSNDLRSVIDIYRHHVDSLNLAPDARRKADKAARVIEGELADSDPDQGVVQAAGKSLKTIVEGAIGGALGNAAASPGVWSLLFSLF